MAETDLFAQVKQQAVAPQSFTPMPKAVNDLAAMPKPTAPKPEVAINQTAPGGATPLPKVVADPAPTPLPQATDGPFTLDTTKAEPILSTVDKATETVQGQLNSLFDEGSPLMVQARNRAMAAAAGRGLQNSSLAVGAAQGAQIAAGLPIAQQDAATYSGRAQLNNETANKYGLADQAAQANLNQLRESGNIQGYLDKLNAGYKQDQTNLEGEIAKDQSLLDHANKLIEMSKSGEIEASLLQTKYGFDSKLSAQENVQRLSELAAQGDINAKLQLHQFNYDTLLADQAAGNALTLEDKRIQANQNLVLLEYQQRGVLSEKEAQQEMERLNQQHQNTLDEIEAQVAASGSADAANASRAIQSQYLNAVSGRQMAASEEIARIYQTEGLTSSQQNAAVQNAYNRMRTDLDLLASYYSNLPVWPAGTPTQPASGTPASTTPTTTAPTSGGPTTGDYQAWMGRFLGTSR